MMSRMKFDGRALAGTFAPVAVDVFGELIST
jgi:hypothetical protein